MTLCCASIITDNGCDYKCGVVRQSILSMFSQEEEINQVQKELGLREAGEESCRMRTTKFKVTKGPTVNEQSFYSQN